MNLPDLRLHCYCVTKGERRYRTSESVIQEWENEIKELQAEIERLRGTVAPFAKLGRRLPSNWPAECPLRIDFGIDDDDSHYEWVAYHGVGNDGEPVDCSNPLLPTIGEWRKAADAAREE